MKLLSKYDLQYRKISRSWKKCYFIAGEFKSGTPIWELAMMYDTARDVIERIIRKVMLDLDKKKGKK